MKNFILTLLLAVLVVLVSSSLRQAFAIGGAPPPRMPSAVGIGGAPPPRMPS
jgi:hypothetical protein